MVEEKELIKLLHMNLEWDKVLGIIEMHRVGGIGWLNLNKYFFNDNKNRCKFPRLYKFLKNSYSAQKLRAEEHLKYTSLVCLALTENNISYVLLKGLSLSEYVYNDLGLRDFNDNDILVHPNDIEKAKNIIMNLGYEQGETKHYTKIIKSNRKEQLVRKLSSHEIIPLIRDVSGSEIFLTQHIIDLHFSVNLMTKERSNNITTEFLSSSRSITIKGNQIQILNKENLLIFLTEHFYKEAISYRDVTMYKDLLLYKLCDIYYLINKNHIDWDYILEFANKNNFEKQLYFALVYVQEAFNTATLTTIINKLDVRENFFDDNVYYYDSSDIAFTYNSGSLIERMFDIDKPKRKVFSPQK
ncbi:nucleotidyltransferase domain-containing protein [Rossellomorea vietnamensis]|nr:nucleotidyltransferase family protein [Rossellomorea vietnamensis]